MTDRQHFSVPSTFFFVISYVEVLNRRLTLATYEKRMDRMFRLDHAS